MKKYKFVRLSLLSIILILGMIACGGNNNDPEPDPDPDALTVTLTSSSTNVTTAGQITLTATATGGTLASVQFQKNGANLGNAVAAAPFTFTVDLTSADNGTINFAAIGTDADAKTDTSDIVAVTVNIANDVSPPTITLTADATNITAAGNVELTATVTDDIGVARVEFFKNGAPLGQDFTEPFSFQAFLTQTDNGTVNYTAKAFDAAGNSADSATVPVAVSISVATLLRPSKSGAIAISGNNNYIIQANPENDTVTVFRSRIENNEREITELGDVSVGEEPSSVVIDPDDETAYVAVRGSAEIVKINGINTGSPVIGSPRLKVGSEPTGIAMSPSGKLLVVAEFGESRVSVVDTATMTILSSVEVRNPRAVAITNDGDGDDTDEKVVVTEFYGEVQDAEDEGQDNSRQGVVRIYNLGATSITPFQKVNFAPVAVNEFEPDQTSPNQLYSVVITPDNSKFIVTATAASPFRAPGFNRNIFQLLLVGDVNTGAVLKTVNVSELVKQQLVAGGGFERFFMADIVDIATVGNNVLYLASRGADAFQRLEFEDGNLNNPQLGAGDFRPAQVDLLNAGDPNNIGEGCKAPIGLVVPHDLSDNGNMYVNCWVSRNMAVVDLAQQAPTAFLEAGTPPSAGFEEQINEGLRFYFTGRARWSNESWSSCGSCHPDGLSDNITWQFPAGPRQTVSMDGTFSKSLPQKQRVLNWTAVFDELHDFERNTRNVSGGIGALVNNAALVESSQLNITGIGGVGLPLKDVQDRIVADPNGGVQGPSVLKDWDEIELWSKTIRPPLAKQFSPEASVTAGRTLFDGLGCDSCHGGQGWTVSRLFYTPDQGTNENLITEVFSAVGSPQSFQIEAEPTDVAGAFIAPPHISCVLRQVGTFGVGGENGVNDKADTDLVELKANGTRAQGEFAGYNIPSLYGLQAGAPYLHNGQAKTLEALLDPDGDWQDHLEAGNPNFKAILNAGNLPSLIDFLLSIDASTAEFDVPAGADFCPPSFP